MSNWVKKKDVIEMLDKLQTIVIDEEGNIYPKDSHSNKWREEYFILVRRISLALFNEVRWKIQSDYKTWYDKDGDDYIDFFQLDNRIVDEIRRLKNG